MGASVDLTGRSEAETLSNQLKWLIGWSRSFLRSMRMMYNAIETVRNIHHYGSNDEGCDKLFFQSQLDQMVVLLDGPATEMRHKFHLHHVGGDEAGDLPVHISLEKAMEELLLQCEGKKPIPVKEPLHVGASEESDAHQVEYFENSIKLLCDTAAGLQKILKDVKTQSDRKLHFVMNVDVVDDNGTSVRVDGFDPDVVINKFNEDRIKKAAESFAGPKGGEEGVSTDEVSAPSSV